MNADSILENATDEQLNRASKKTCSPCLVPGHKCSEERLKFITNMITPKLKESATDCTEGHGF
jgi:hypothetical protein